MHGFKPPVFSMEVDFAEVVELVVNLRRWKKVNRDVQV